MENYATLPDGRLLLADGINNMKVWDGLAAAPVDAGLAAPGTALTIQASAATGRILGTFQAYVRFLDALGQVSDFSPVSATILTNATNAAGKWVKLATQTNPVVITNADAAGTLTAHGLSTGDKITISGAIGMTELDGDWTVTVLTATTFSLDTSEGLSFGEYTTMTASWEAGVSYIAYSAIPQPTTAKAVLVQVLRNTAGEFTTFYVDLELAVGVTSGTSSKEDDTLATGTAVPLLNTDGTLNAMAHGVPPNFKSVVAHHLGRVFAAVDGVVTEGAVWVFHNNNTVFGIGTHWKSTLAGRFLYVNGATQTYQITSVDETAQTLTLTAQYTDSAQGFALYAIRPAPAQRRLVYYSEAGQPESMPATNAFAVQEDGDEITGLLQKGSFVFIVETRHIYRYTFLNNPATDGQTFLCCQRGAVNNRCIVQVEDNAYMLDAAGIHAFGGAQDTQPISTPIQKLFQPGQTQYGINWNASDTFHAAVDPTTEVVRFFVALGGSTSPRHAICYHYRLQRWWIEEYKVAIGASASGQLGGYRQLFAAGQFLGVWLLDRGKLDLLDERHASLTGTISSAGTASIVDAAAEFTADLVGQWFYTTDGTGRLQARLIIAVPNSTSLRLRDPWLRKPDNTTKYQIGGIPFYYLSASYFFARAHQESERAFCIYWTPTQAPGSFDLRIYYDSDETPQAMRNSHTNKAEGFASTLGGTELTADTTRADGYAQQRLDNRRADNLPGPRQVSFELLGVAGADGLAVSQIEIVGAEPGGAG